MVSVFHFSNNRGLIFYAVLFFLLSLGAQNMVAYDLYVDLNCLVCTMKQMLQGSFSPIHFLLAELSSNQVIQFEKYLHDHHLAVVFLRLILKL